MEQFLSEIEVKTSGEGFINLTSEINNWISKVKLDKGIIVISTQHTSCSLIINENADPKVLKDLSSYMKALVPEENYAPINNPAKIRSYLHSQEGVDDMPAHIKTVLTSTSISLSVSNTRLMLGTWQAIYLWEHRYAPSIRRVNIHGLGVILAK